MWIPCRRNCSGFAELRRGEDIQATKAVEDAASGSRLGGSSSIGPRPTLPQLVGQSKPCRSSPCRNFSSNGNRAGSSGPWIGDGQALSPGLGEERAATAFREWYPMLRVVGVYAARVSGRFLLSAWPTDARMHAPEGVRGCEGHSGDLRDYVGCSRLRLPVLLAHCTCRPPRRGRSKPFWRATRRAVSLLCGRGWPRLVLTP